MEKHMTSSQILIILTIILYMAGMLAIGAFFNRKGATNTSDGFYIGGRSLGPVVTAMSAEASDMSSYLLMGLPGLAYIAGLAEVTWTAIGLSIGTYLNFLLVARLLRRYSEKIGAFTIPDFYSRRYKDERHLLSCIAAVIILIFFIPYTASGFKAVGTMFNSLFGFDYHVAMIIGAIIIIAYTTMGGFLAVSTTDLVQSIFMSVALIIIVFFGISDPGLRYGQQYSVFFRCFQYCVYAGLGPWIFWHAAHPSSLHGNQKRKGTGPFPPHCGCVGCDLHGYRGVHWCDRI